MQTLIVHPENKEQLTAIKAFMKALKISFEEKKSDYDPEFVEKIEKSRAQVKNGETRSFNLDEL